MDEEYIRTIFNNCAVCRPLGIEITELREGYARGVLTIRDDHLNPFGSVHGGVIFSFADHVGGACGNTLGLRATLVESTIQYARPVYAGEVLIAEARLRHKSRKIGRLDVEVLNARNEPAAFMHQLFFISDHEHKNKTPKDPR